MTHTVFAVLKNPAHRAGFFKTVDDKTLNLKSQAPKN